MTIKMDPNKFYCRNGPHQVPSANSIPPSPLNKKHSSDNSVSEYISCGSNNTSSNFNCKDMLSRSGTNKPTNHSRNNTESPYGTECSNNKFCTATPATTGNYINSMPAPIGTLQYHRRKLTPQEFEPRLYYNTSDIKCRDEYYMNRGSDRYNSTSSSPAPLHLSNQPQEHVHHHLSQHQNLFHIQHHQLQPFLNHINENQAPQHQHNHQMQHQHQHQPLCSLNSSLDPINESLNCAVFPSHNGRVVTATQTHQRISGNGTLEQNLPLNNVQPPPLMYTVHRVVTTAEIQTTAGSTFAASSSVASIVSTARNENEYLIPNNTAIGGVGTVNSNSDTSNNIVKSGNVIGTVSGFRSPPGTSSNPVPLSVQSKTNNISEVQQISTPSNKTNISSSAGYSIGAKTSSLVTRPLQNVIPTCVYLMSRIAVHMEIEGTAHCPTQVMLAAALGCEELGIANKLLAQSIFGLWMASTLLEIQLKSHHCPYVVRAAWPNLLEKFSHGSPIDKKFDEPMILLKRNVFFSKRDEEKIKDHRILELLFEEAKQNVLSGKYVMEPVHSLMLGGLQARIELGPFNPHTHTIGFFRENQTRFLPQHVAKSSSWSWLPVSRKNSAEVKLMEQFKRLNPTATTRKLMRKYLEFCWALPFYGAAFFHGQVEQPVHGIMNLVNNKDIEVSIAVNERGVYIIDPLECTLLLGLRYEDLSWDYAKPSTNDDPECITCIFIEFDVVENGVQSSKLMQIFSRQAAMIDALILHFTEQMKKKKQDGIAPEHDEPNLIQNNGNGVLCNKLSRLILATFDEEGRCIGQMGSLSISY